MTVIPFPGTHLTINTLRRRALLNPLTLKQFRDSEVGWNMRGDLLDRIWLNTHWINIASTYSNFAEGEVGLRSLIGPALTLVVFSPVESVSIEEAEWIRDRFYRPGEYVVGTHLQRGRGFFCKNPKYVPEPEVVH